MLSDVKKIINENFSDLKISFVKETILLVDPKDLPKIVSFLKENDETKLDYLSSITGADYLEYLESVYHLYSIKKKHGPITLRIRVPRDNPRVPSIVSIYKGAEFQERETYDTFGIIYEGHPDLRRLFLWENFEGFPLRKDYKQEDSDILEPEDLQWLEKNKQ